MQAGNFHFIESIKSIFSLLVDLFNGKLSRELTFFVERQQTVWLEVFKMKFNSSVCY